MSLVKNIPAYRLRQVAFSYGGSLVIEGVTADIMPLDYLGIIGPNGGGKTTLLKILLGLLTPTSGQVSLFGTDIASSSERKRIGYVPQRSQSLGDLFPATVEEVVRSGRTPLKAVFDFYSEEDLDIVNEACVTAQINHLRNRRIGELSGGERQRVLIARALAVKPRILILDEPTSAVDVQSQELFFEFLRDIRHRLSLTIILVSHDVDVISHEVDQVLCLNRHMICHGPTKDVMPHASFIHGHK